MELKEFIVSAITDLTEGVVEADAAIKEHGGMVNPGTHQGAFGPNNERFQEFVYPRTTLNFDIAISASKTGGTAADAKAKIWVVEASIGGDSEAQDETVSRLTFSLDVVLPSDRDQKGRLGAIRSPSK